MPLRDRIHSSVVSMMRASFSFGTTFFGMPIPLPVITLFMDGRAYTARRLLLRQGSEATMKRAIICATVLLAFACMQKQPDGSYKVTDTATSDAAKKAHDDAVKTGDQIKKTGEDIGKSDAVQKIKNGSVEVGRGVKEGLGQAAQKAGAGLQKAGKKAEDEVKKTEKTTTH